MSETISGVRTPSAKDPRAGEVIYCSRPTMAHGGGPDGHYWTVERVTVYGEGDHWIATMRPSTTEEAAPVAARRAEKAAKAAANAARMFGEQR